MQNKLNGIAMATSFRKILQWSVLCLATALLIAGVGRTVTATAAAAADDAGKTTFVSNCSICHAEDGSGDTPIGMSLQIPDLRSDDVQKLPDADLIDTVTNGKEPMPAFKDKLTAAEIKGVVGYVRTFAKKK